MLTKSILQKIGKNLHNKLGHPLRLSKDYIFSFFSAFERFDNIDPYVVTRDNFEFAIDPSLKEEAFIENPEVILRSHMGAHLREFLSNKHERFLLCGDVYRNDGIIDNYHGSVFHQILGFCVVDDSPTVVLQDVLAKLIGSVGWKFRFNDSNVGRYGFISNPFDLEAQVTSENTKEVKFVKLLTGGSVSPEIMKEFGLEGKKAYTFLLGLDRFSMLKSSIPHIKVLWNKSESKGYRSKYLTTHRDISFCVPEKFNQNKMYSLVKEEAEDYIEEVRFIDNFTNIITEKKFSYYRILFGNPYSDISDKEIKMVCNSICSRIGSEFEIKVNCQ